MAIPGTHLISNEDFWDTHFQHLNVQEPDIAFAYLATVKCTKTRLEISKTITDVRSRHRELGISWSMSSSPDPPAGDPWLPPPSGILWEDDPRAQFRREMTCAATEAGVVVPRFLSLEGNSEEGSDNITCAPEHQIIPESLEPVKPFDVIKVESSPFKPIPTTPDTNTIHRVEGARISKVALRRGRAPEDVPTIKCPVDGCTKLYTTKAGLKYHTSVHIESPSKLYMQLHTNEHF